MKRPFHLMRSFLMICIVWSIAFGNLRADDTQARTGRLKDGRPYRVDENGNQLVDRMAELEVTVGDLQREVSSLQDELRDKDGMIKQLGGARPAVRTSALPPAASSVPPKCNELVSNLVLKVSQLENRLRSQPSSVQAAAAVQVPKGCDYDSPENPLWDQVNKLQAELMKAPSVELLAREREHNKHLENQIEETQEGASEKEQRALILSEKLKEANERASALEKELGQQTDRRKVALDIEESRGRLARQVPSQEYSHSEGDVGVIRAELNASLKKISALISDRKDFLDNLRKKNSTISISIQPLVTQNGVSLDSLRARVSHLSSAEDVPEIRTGLGEISKLLQDDINTLRRLLKM